MSAPIASTTQGKVEGIEKLDCLQFRGIPFAAPPVGDLRWKLPKPHPSWDGVRDATEFGPICHQVAGTMEQLGGDRQAEPDPQSEDCLTLNVFTPGVDDSKRPVMVWIHGGGFSTGSGRVPWYSAHNFARDGVVAVTINYRINAFGFLHLEELFGPEFAHSGVCGIADQVAALQWVADNIANFGGDPGNVTIFGESAGGMSVGTLLATPGAKGLFSKAIPQSGAAHATNSQEIATRIAKKFCTYVAVSPGDADSLSALTADQLLDAVNRFGAGLATDNAEIFGGDFAGFAMPFQPVWGSDVLPTAPIEALQQGAGTGVATLVGTTLEEWKLFTLMLGEDSLRTRAVRPLRNLCARAGRSVDDVIATYEEKIGGSSELDLRNALETDRNFRIPAIRLAEAQVSNATPTWMYRFDWKTPAFGGRMGACHALEIPFVFDNLDAPGVDIFTGGAAPQSLATNMHAAWVAFARTGDPNTSELPDWPGYDIDRRATMLLDSEPAVADDPDGKLRALWDGLQ
ncbi:MAG: carboxylesterase/lipase family protein [Actinomycetota bacterium]